MSDAIREYLPCAREGCAHPLMMHRAHCRGCERCSCTSFVFAERTAIDERDQWRRRAQLIEKELVSLKGTLGAIELEVENRFSGLTLIALSFAAIHCGNEAALFEAFVDARINDKMTGREPFSISRTEAGSTLREIGRTLSAAADAIAELRAILARARARQASAQPESSIAPQPSAQTPPASS